MPSLSAHSLTNASYSGSRSRFILIGMPQIGERCGAWTAEIPIHAPQQALVVRDEHLGVTSALPYADCGGPPNRRNNVRTSDELTCTGIALVGLPLMFNGHGQHSRSSIGRRKSETWTEESTQRVESFNPCPIGPRSLDEFLFAAKVICAAGPLLPH